MSVDTRRSEQPGSPRTGAERGRAPGIRSLTVVAGPTAVGKSRLLQLIAADGELRSRLGVPPASPVVIAGGFVKVGRAGPIDDLTVHYDILRPHIKGFGSHAADPATSLLADAEAIAFLTLTTTRERLVAQLAERVAGHRRPPKKLLKLQPLYERGDFLADWYGRWFRFLERFERVTTRSAILDTGDDYRLAARTWV